MGLRILTDKADEQAIMYCSTSMWAFGPVIDADSSGAEHKADAFIDYLPQDARRYTPVQLEALWGEFNDKYHECKDCGEWTLKDCACPHCAEETIERR